MIADIENEVYNLHFGFDGIKAFLTVKSKGVYGGLNSSDIINFLRSSGIIHGIKEDVINRLVNEQEWDSKILVAAGEEPINGEDGEVEYFFQTDIDLSPKIQDDGSVDFHELSLIQNVRSGQKLAKVILPTEGKTGLSVLGEPISPVPGKSARLIAGQNTEFIDKAETELVAKVDGHVRLHDGCRVIVETIFKTEGNVDFGIGNIDVTGDVKVNGDILAGFEVKTTGNVLVLGTVEDAVIKAGGNVIVKGGFVGSGKGKIISGNNVTVRFIHNQTIEADGDIIVGEEAVHARLISGRAVQMNKGKGIIIGGYVQAEEYINAKSVGSEQGVETVLAVAYDDSIAEELLQLEKSMKLPTRQLDEAMQKVLSITDQVYHQGWDEIKEKRYKELYERANEICRKRNEIALNFIEIKSQMTEHCVGAYIKITREIFPRVQIKISGLSKTIKERHGGSEYRLKDDRIVTL